MKSKLDILNEMYEHLRSLGKIHTQKELAAQIKVSVTSLSSAFNGNERYLTDNLLKKICSRYHSVFNIDYFLTGDGEMIKPEKQPEPKHYGADYMAKIKKELSEPKKNIVPVYDEDTVRTFGGINGYSADVETAVSEPAGYIDAGSWFGDRITQAIRHYGDSMIEYQSGCTLALREIFDKNEIVWGRNYVIETNQNRVTKRLQKCKDDDNYIMAYSSNEETYQDGTPIHEPFRIKKDNIRHIFVVIGMIAKEESAGIMKVIN